MPYICHIYTVYMPYISVPVNNAEVWIVFLLDPSALAYFTSFIANDDKHAIMKVLFNKSSGELRANSAFAFF